MQFKASLDTGSKIVSIAVVLFSVIYLITVFSVFRHESFLIYIPASILILTVSFTWLYAPLTYEITNDSIEIVRRINTFRIARKEILSIEKLSEEEMGRAWRMMGNGGMFGYTGWFRSSKQGKMRWFVTQRKNYISIVLNNQQKFILSPDDTNAFMEAIQW
jgi:hypothetical protein